MFDIRIPNLPVCMFGHSFLLHPWFPHPYAHMELLKLWILYCTFHSCNIFQRVYRTYTRPPVSDKMLCTDPDFPGFKNSTDNMSKISYKTKYTLQPKLKVKAHYFEHHQSGRIKWVIKYEPRKFTSSSFL